MIDLSAIPDELRLARGDYSTVRAAHEDSKKDLQILCGQLASVATQVLRKMQPDEDEAPDSVASLLEKGKQTLDMMQACTERIESLAKQRSALKSRAWPK